jgi:elongation factor G
MADTAKGARVVALVGSGGAGKTTLAEAMLFAAGATTRTGSVDAGSSVGDSSAEARARRGSTELNLYRYEYLGDRFAILDAPGSVGFAADGLNALAASDLAVVVVDPDPDRAVLSEPAMRRLEALGVPHVLFVNRIDQARGHIRELMEALQPMSARPLLARQIPLREGDEITGFVDLALERAYHYRPGKPSERIEIPSTVADREAQERFHMLEQLADHDDTLLEQLLMDEQPSAETIFSDLRRETGESLVVPVLFGSALSGFGIRRLMKLLRHDTPSPDAAAARLGAKGRSAYVFKVSHAGATGRLAFARVFGGTLREGDDIVAPDGSPVRVGTLFSVQGDKTQKLAEAGPGEIVAVAKAEGVAAGDLLGEGARLGTALKPELPPRNFTLAIQTRDRKDDVRLSTAIRKLIEEDPALELVQDEELHETLLKGVNDEHLGVTLARLKRRYGVAVDSRPRRVAYKESIRKSVRQHGRHKKQSGGHGQFGDVIIEVSPLARGEGFVFSEKITGGAIPKQWIPAVEQGVRDAMLKGPLGFPVVDVAVTLVDGSYHTVDSSELAFRTAGRIAMSEALATCSPHLLEPVCRVTIEAPNFATSRVTSAVASRRGQMLGMAPREGWSRWDRIEALLPEAELHGLDAELRSLSQGLATYEARFDHLAELNGKLADEVVQRELEAA